MVTSAMCVAVSSPGECLSGVGGVMS
jgi:hypothetical protein